MDFADMTIQQNKKPDRDEITILPGKLHASVFHTTVCNQGTDYATSFFIQYNPKRGIKGMKLQYNISYLPHNKPEVYIRNGNI